MRTALLTFMALLLCASMATAADISGKWFAQVPGPSHLLLEINFVFKVDGANLTGTATFPLGDQVYRLEIQDGKISGQDLAFQCAMKMRDSELKWTYKGTVAGDQIDFTTVVQGGPGGNVPQEYDVTAKKVGP